MCRWIAYRGETVSLEDIIFRPSHSLVDQSLKCREGATCANEDGYGVGWYGARAEPGLFREVLPAWNDPNLAELARHVTSPLIFAHVRASTGSEVSRDNCHPFAHDNWLFMHNGQIGDYETLRGAYEALLSPAVAHLRKGTTDSELFFLLALQNGLRSDPERALKATIGQIAAVAERHGSADPFKLTVCVSDGERLIACRHASEGPAPSLYWQVRRKAVLVASEPSDCDAAPWNEIAINSIVTVGRRISIEPLFSKRGHVRSCRILPMREPRAAVA